MVLLCWSELGVGFGPRFAGSNSIQAVPNCPCLEEVFLCYYCSLWFFFLPQIKFGVCHGGMFTSNGEQEGISVECTFADSLCFIVNKFRRVLGGRGWGPVQWGPSWTNLDIALYRWMCGPAQGEGPAQRWDRARTPEQNDRHDKKNYLPTTSLAGGKKTFCSTHKKLEDYWFWFTSRTFINYWSGL